MLLCQTMQYPDGKFVLYVATRNSDREFNETRREYLDQYLNITFVLQQGDKQNFDSH